MPQLLIIMQIPDNMDHSITNYAKLKCQSQKIPTFLCLSTTRLNNNFRINFADFDSYGLKKTLKDNNLIFLISIISVRDDAPE